MNDPKKQVLSVGGTEYSATETARTVLHILNNEGSPVNDVSCNMNVRNSKDKTIRNNQSLNYVNGSNGIYSYDFITSLPYGVYSVDAWCKVDNTTIYVADTFHVAPWTEALDDANGFGIGGGIAPSEISRVSGTEYQLDEDAHILVQVLQGGVPDNTAECIIDIFAPNASFSNDIEQVIFSDNMEYVTDSNGMVKKVNLIVATAQNNAAMGMSVKKAAQKLIKNGAADNAILDMVEMAFRAYDPCLACATHCLPGQIPLEVRLIKNGKVYRRMTRNLNE